jgi:hypothetical protein
LVLTGKKQQAKRRPFGFFYQIHGVV